MGLMDVVRGAVATAASVTADLQALVTYEKFIQADGAGDPVFVPGVQVRALVTKKSRHVMTPSGHMAQSVSEVVFLDPSIVVSVNDRITLPDGTTGPILATNGFVDSAVGAPILTQVYLGASPF